MTRLQRSFLVFLSLVMSLCLLPYCLLSQEESGIISGNDGSVGQRRLEDGRYRLLLKIAHPAKRVSIFLPNFDVNRQSCNHSPGWAVSTARGETIIFEHELGETNSSPLYVSCEQELKFSDIIITPDSFRFPSLASFLDGFSADKSGGYEVKDLPPLAKVDHLRDVLIAPAFAEAGSKITITPRFAQDSVAWALLDGSIVEKASYDNGKLSLRIPPGINVARSRIICTDAWGERLVDLPIDDFIEITNGYNLKEGNIKYYDTVSAGGLLCLSGDFRNFHPDTLIVTDSKGRETSLPIGSKVDAAASSVYNLILQLPTTLPAGRYSAKLTQGTEHLFLLDLQVVKVSYMYLGLGLWEVMIQGTDRPLPIFVYGSEFGSLNIKADSLLSSGGERNLLAGTLNFFKLKSDSSISAEVLAICPNPFNASFDGSISMDRITKPSITTTVPSEEEIKGGLRVIAGDLLRRRYALRERLLSEGFYEVDDVKDVIDPVGSAALNLLKGPKQLAALRDYISQEFDRARKKIEDGSYTLEARSRCHYCSQPTQSFALVSTGKPGNEIRLTKEGLTNEVLAFLQGIMDHLASADHLTLTICVTTEPEGGATFTFYPSSIPDEEHPSFSTNGDYPNVWIGRYKYKIEKRGYVTVKDQFFDFIDPASAAIECPLTREGLGDASPCRPARQEVRAKCPNK